MHVRASIIDLVEISQLNNLLILCCWNRLKLSKLVLLNDRMWPRSRMHRLKKIVV